jgi:hypothetical protein
MRISVKEVCVTSMNVNAVHNVPVTFTTHTLCSYARIAKFFAAGAEANDVVVVTGAVALATAGAEVWAQMTFSWGENGRMAGIFEAVFVSKRMIDNNDESSHLIRTASCDVAGAASPIAVRHCRPHESGAAPSFF